MSYLELTMNYLRQAAESLENEPGDTCDVDSIRKKVKAGTGYAAKFGKDAGNVIDKMVKNGALVVQGEGNANLGLDTLLQSVAYYLTMSHDPLKKEDVDEGVVWLKVWGLKSIHRIGSATMTQHLLYLIFMNASIGFDDLVALTYIERQLWWWVWFKGKIRADIPNLILAIKLRISIVKKMKPKLESLKVEDWGAVRTEITDANWLGTVVSWFPFITNTILKSTLPEKIQAAAEDILELIDFKLP